METKKELEQISSQELEQFEKQWVAMNSGKFENGRVSLHSSVRIDTSPECKQILMDIFLLKNNINEQDNFGNTPLHEAVDAKQINAVKLLLNMAAFPDKKNNKGLTPLDIAKKNEFMEAIPLLERAIEEEEQERQKAIQANEV